MAAIIKHHKNGVSTIISDDGMTTIAFQITKPGKHVHIANAICSKMDIPRKKEGRKLARARLACGQHIVLETLCPDKESTAHSIIDLFCLY